MSDTSTNDNGNFPPDRKVWTAQLALLVTFVIATVLSARGIDLPAPEQLALCGLIGMALSGFVGYIVPMARQEITRRMTNSMVAQANADPTSPVDLSKIIDNKIIREAQQDPENTAATAPIGESAPAKKPRKG